MRAEPTDLSEVLLLSGDAFSDDRGFLRESFNQRDFVAATGIEVDFVQDNLSHSRRGVLRGVHYQVAPHAQGKLVTVIGGSGFFGRHLAQELLARGARLRIASRNPRRAFALKPLGNLGQHLAPLRRRGERRQRGDVKLILDDAKAEDLHAAVLQHLLRQRQRLIDPGIVIAVRHRGRYR